MVKVTPFPAGFRVRPATMDDLEAVLHVQIAHERADFGEPLSDKDSLWNTWQSPSVDLKADTWVVEAPDGQIVSYARVRGKGRVQIFANVWLLPEYRGHGIGRHLLSLAEAQAQQRIAEAPSGARVTMNATRRLNTFWSEQITRRCTASLTWNLIWICHHQHQYGIMGSWFGHFTQGKTNKRPMKSMRRSRMMREGMSPWVLGSGNGRTSLILPRYS